MARRGDLFIVTEGMRQMENDFQRMSTPEPIEHAKERLNVAAENIFAKTQALVPEGEGDARRPAGSLRASGRVNSHSAGGDFWNVEIAYGTDDDVMPYAVWARWKHHRKTGVDYMSPTDDPDDTIAEAMNSAFDDVWHGEH